MNTQKPRNIFCQLIFNVLIITLIVTAFQNSYLLTSFQINFAGQQIPIISLNSKPESDNLITQYRRTYLSRGLNEKNGYTISFDIKTENQNQKEKPIIYTTDKSLGAIYRNISLMDGKIETNHTQEISPIITINRINDNNWHNILIYTDNNFERIFVDGKLDNIVSVNLLNTPDKWLVVDIDNILTSESKIYIRELTLINDSVSPKRFTVFKEYYLGNSVPLTLSIFFVFLKNIILYSLIYALLVLLIKKRSPQSSFPKITKNLINNNLFIFIPVLFMWTVYIYQISFISYSILFYRLQQEYDTILPKYIRTPLLTTLSFIFASTNLLFTKKFKEFNKYLFLQKPETYFYLFLYLGIIFSLNRILK
jgi:hypothetical protein